MVEMEGKLDKVKVPGCLSAPRRALTRPCTDTRVCESVCVCVCAQGVPPLCAVHRAWGCPCLSHRGPPYLSQGAHVLACVSLP